MSSRAIRTLLWSSILLLGVCLVAVNAMVARQGWSYWVPVLGLSLLVVTIGGLIAYVFARSYSLQASQLRTYTEQLLDAQPPDMQLPAGDDELGALARSLQR